MQSYRPTTKEITSLVSIPGAGREVTSVPEFRPALSALIVGRAKFWCPFVLLVFKY